MHDSAERRSHRILGLAVLVAALFLGVAPCRPGDLAHGTRQPSRLPGRARLHGRDRLDVRVVSAQPNWAPPSTLQIGVSGPQGGLLRGVYEVPPEPLQLTAAEIMASHPFDGFMWRPGKFGLFDHHATIRLAFRPGVQVPEGSQVKITWHWTTLGGFEIYTVDNCTIAAFPPPAP